MLKKIFSTLLLCLALTLVGNSQAEAREVYVGSYSDGTSVYLLTDTVAGGPSSFDCKVRAGYDYIQYSFFMRGSDPYYRNNEGYEGYVYGGQSPVAKSIWEWVHKYK